MRRAIWAGTAAALSLAGCGEPAEQASGEITMEEAAERAEASGIKPEPGQYRVTTEVLAVEIPGAPPEMANMMRGALSSSGSSQEYCLTQADVDKGFEEMARQSQDQDCSFERFDVNGGDIDARMVCNVPGQGTMTMTMQGSGTPTSSEMDMTMTGDLAGMGEATIRMKANHQRIGECS